MNLIEVEALLEEDLSNVSDKENLEELRIKYLGRNGVVPQLLTTLVALSDDERKQFGKELNLFKTKCEKRFAQKQNELLKNQTADWFDVTLPGATLAHGSLHLVTLAIEEIATIFTRLGFIRMSYPEVEWEYFAFESLNMPPKHPARDDFETFFIDTPAHPKLGRMLLTPHTSSGQVREMKRVGKPPIKMINIGKTYRPNWDVSHVPMFHQFEGLCIDKNITIGDLKGTIEYFAKSFFGEKRNIRLRPFHFQFTEPSFEVDITCDICDGTGLVTTGRCKLCKSGWLELGGAGMVHPAVLDEGGIDSKLYSGWAFGFGIERVMMMKEGIKLDDIRILYSNDIRFLEQF